MRQPAGKLRLANLFFHELSNSTDRSEFKPSEFIATEVVALDVAGVCVDAGGRGGLAVFDAEPDFCGSSGDGGICHNGSQSRHRQTVIASGSRSRTGRQVAAGFEAGDGFRCRRVVDLFGGIAESCAVRPAAANGSGQSIVYPSGSGGSASRGGSVRPQSAGGGEAETALASAHA